MTVRDACSEKRFGARDEVLEMVVKRSLALPNSNLVRHVKFTLGL
jgi:hypothetical protein